MLSELWLEVNIIRKFGVFINQCFADNISRAIISNSKDNNSKIARQVWYDNVTSDINK